MAGPDTTLAALQRHDKFYILGGDLYTAVWATATREPKKGSS